jgi:hypothetical protein
MWFKLLLLILSFLLLCAILGKYIIIPIILLILWIIVRLIADIYWHYKDRKQW